MPVVQEKLARLLIVMLSLVAGGTKGNSLDKRTSSKKIKDLPDELPRKRLVTRKDLALGIDSS
jgi:hypothetical protein